MRHNGRAQMRRGGRMRIGITLQSLDPTWGGIGIYTEEIVRHLLKIDRKNQYLLIYPGFGPARARIGQFKRKYDNVEEIITPGWRLPVATWWDQVVLPRTLREHKVDVLFNPYWSVPLRGDYRKVIIMHAVERHTLGNVFDLKRRVQQAIREAVLIGSADRIISISQVMTHDLQLHMNVPGSKIRTVYHGLHEKFRVIRNRRTLARMRAEYRLPEQFILFVGHIYPQKNFGNLLRAFRKIADDLPHHLVVAGQPRWHFAQDYALIEQLGLKERVRFLHFVENDHLPYLYNLAACFVFPSFYEAFGLALVEAMACGCPVAAADAGAIPEVADGAALLFDPHAVGEIERSVRSLLTDPEVRQAHVERGLERARDFSWERCAAGTLAVLEEVVTGRLAAARPAEPTPPAIAGSGGGGHQPSAA
jgi:glycosyltransferase involved in cell wall biosynthesis